MSIKHLKKTIAGSMAVTMLMTAMPINIAQADMVTTDQVIEELSVADARTRVMSFVLREDVGQQLTMLGVEPEEAARRVAGLSDHEIEEIAGRLDELPAGQSAVGAVVGAIVVIFLVLLITDLVGLTDVFPFVRSHRSHKLLGQVTTPRQRHRPYSPNMCARRVLDAPDRPISPVARSYSYEGGSRWRTVLSSGTVLLRTGGASDGARLDRGAYQPERASLSGLYPGPKRVAAERYYCSRSAEWPNCSSSEES